MIMMNSVCDVPSVCACECEDPVVDFLGHAVFPITLY